MVLCNQLSQTGECHAGYGGWVVQSIKSACFCINDRSHKVASIQWRKASSWAADIEKWVRATGRGNTVCTIYEITDGDDTEGEPFHGLDRAVITEALRYLEKHGKAEIMDGGEGVKFFI
ncbi:vacuolar protein sorting associated protein 25 [Echinococcus multilocularis]|uniref:Vacuolar protein-sorting-associated protein 25 n=1 Tax=Echinococcus multilocularis TaxID=6211 RepID=A0A087VZF3_ECHMU|nr:vacuolar protein sorting associated protein 25 [Echinococcus multilocularis]